MTDLKDKGKTKIDFVPTLIKGPSKPDWLDAVHERARMKYSFWKARPREHVQTREELRAFTQAQHVIHQAANRLYELMHTSGSTGTPACVLLGPDENQAYAEAGHALFMNAGVGLEQLRVARLDRGQTHMGDQLLALSRMNVSAILSNAGYLTDLAQSYPALCANLRLRLVTSTGEAFDSREQKAETRERFGCRLLEVYSSRECGYIAWECEHGYMWVDSPRVYVEQHEDELLITTRRSNLTPVLRYQIGDVGEVRHDVPCSCGHARGATQWISGLEGRKLPKGPQGEDTLKLVKLIRQYATQRAVRLEWFHVDLFSQRPDIARVIYTSPDQGENWDHAAERALRCAVLRWRGTFLHLPGNVLIERVSSPLVLANGKRLPVVSLDRVDIAPALASE